MSYRIKSVSSLTGISAATLRAWERRYDLVCPRRTEGGYRAYSDEDLQLLVKVKALVDRGMRVGEAIDLVRRDAPELAPAESSRDALAERRRELLEALLHFDRAEAFRVTAALVSVPADRQLEEIYLPLLREMGERWAACTATIAQEHFATAFVRDRLSGMMADLGPGPEDAPEALCACLPGERHELGLMAVAVHLAMHGWRITYLGADVPLDEIARTTRERRPDLLCLSAMVHLEPEGFDHLVGSIAGMLPTGTIAVIGGRGLPSTTLPTSSRVHLLPVVDNLLTLVGEALGPR